VSCGNTCFPKPGFKDAKVGEKKRDSLGFRCAAAGVRQVPHSALWSIGHALTTDAEFTPKCESDEGKGFAPLTAME
jgi:hypothetical protein